MEQAQKFLKLNLGCGADKKEGWVNLDSVEQFKPDALHDLSEPLPYGDLSVDEIKAYGLLEHFDKYMRFIVFFDWTRVLKIGGLIHIEVPDFQKILSKKRKFTDENFVDFLFGENIIRSQTYIGHFGNHKWGYSQKSLKEFTAKFGIEPVATETRGLNIYLTGKKTKHVSRQELDETVIYSHANNFGEFADPHIKLSRAKEMIKRFQDQKN